MSKEEVGISVTKEQDFSEWYTQVVIKAKLADYAPVKGLIVLRPDGYSVWESLKETLDAQFSKREIRNGFLPILIPESLLKKEEKHFSGFDPEVFWVTHSGTNEIGDRLALRPTSETLAYSMYSKWIQSWRDLPLKINFWNTALRAEIKATKPFLRTSEFLWQEGHTVHTTQLQAEQEVAEILEIYKNTIQDELAIPVVAGRKSEKEKFVGAIYTTTMESIMPDGKALQMGTSHFLGQNFSKPFEVKFADKDNIEHFAWQTSWGVSWRLIGAMIMIHGDDTGLVLPPKVAPIQVVIVPIFKEKDQTVVYQKAEEIKSQLQEKNIRVKIDKRAELTPGYKFNDWELKGIPIRIEIGPKDIANNAAILATRHNKEKISVALPEITSKTQDTLQIIQKSMLKKATAMLAEKTIAVSTYDEFKKCIETGGFLKAHWCEDKLCEDKIKEETGGEIRVIPFGSENSDGRCIYCNKQSRSVPLFARGY